MLRVALLAIALSAPLSAAVIYSTYSPGDTLNTSMKDGLGLGANDTGFASADAFTVDSEVQVTGYKAMLGRVTGTPSAVFSLWSGVAGPETLIEGGMIVGPVSTLSPTEFTFLSPTNPALLPGTTYWFVGEAQNPTTDTVLWYYSNDLALSRLRNSDSVPWQTQDIGNAFAVLGVPEPGTWLVVGVGAVLIAFSVKRRKL